MKLKLIQKQAVTNGIYYEKDYFALVNHFNTTFVSVQQLPDRLITVDKTNFNTTFVSVQQFYFENFTKQLVRFQYNSCISSTQCRIKL